MVNIRKGTPEDTPALLALIQELADYEKAPDEVEVTAEILRQDGFGPDAIFEFFVAEEEGNILGIALYYTKYSTWKGRCLYLEDIVVRQAQRRRGIGEKLFLAVKEVAARRGVKRMEWQVLEWNAPAIAFYKKQEARFDSEWVNVKFTEEDLK